jgi:hypothetical protein
MVNSPISLIDIVERLRKCLRANAGISGTAELWSPVKDDDIREAADEIERLRASIKHNLYEYAKDRKQAVRAEREAILILV